MARALNYLALALVVGCLLATAVLLPGRRGQHPYTRRAARGAALAAALWAASGLALFAFGLSSAAARPLPEVLTGDLLGRFADTRFGGLVLAQSLAAAVVAVLAAAGRPWLAKAALALAVLGAAAPALWGHAGTDELRLLAVANDWLHVLGVTAWVGGLAALAILLLRRSESAPVAEPAARFSRMAGVALLVVGSTGAVNAALHLSARDQLSETGWGKLVVVKTTLLVLIAGVGYLTRSRILPSLSDEVVGSRRAFARLAGVEVLLMVVAFGVATQMASGVPADAEAASRIQSLATSLGVGQLNVTVEPARAGRNDVHIYVLDDSGRPDRTARDAALVLEQGNRTLESRLFVSGPGHWTALDLHIPSSGEWILQVMARTDDGPVSATGAITVR